MCDINANGPPVGPCLHRAIAEERSGKRGRVDEAWREERSVEEKCR